MDIVAIALFGAMIYGVANHACALDNEPDAQAKRGVAIGQLKQLVIALQGFHDQQKAFPAFAVHLGNGKPTLSWRVAILPFLGEEKLYDEFKHGEPWDSPHNLALVRRMPKVFGHPLSKLNENGCTVYQVARGEATVFSGKLGISAMQILDGTSKTILLVEVDDEHAVPWTSPSDWKLIADRPAAGLGGHFDKLWLCASADGAVHEMPATISRLTLNALFTRAGNEVVKWPE